MEIMGYKIEKKPIYFLNKRRDFIPTAVLTASGIAMSLVPGTAGVLAHRYAEDRQNELLQNPNYAISQSYDAIVAKADSAYFDLTVPFLGKGPESAAAKVSSLVNQDNNNNKLISDLSNPAIKTDKSLLNEVTYELNKIKLNSEVQRDIYLKDVPEDLLQAKSYAENIQELSKLAIAAVIGYSALDLLGYLAKLPFSLRIKKKTDRLSLISG